jgi:hypothetical protein
MVNGVVFFSLGQAAITAYLNAWQNRDFDPLPAIAQAFVSLTRYFGSDADTCKACCRAILCIIHHVASRYPDVL